MIHVLEYTTSSFFPLRVDKKRDKIERKILDSQERAFWDVHRPVVSEITDVVFLVTFAVIEIVCWCYHDHLNWLWESLNIFHADHTRGIQSIITHCRHGKSFTLPGFNSLAAGMHQALWQKVTNSLKVVSFIRKLYIPDSREIWIA